MKFLTIILVCFSIVYADNEEVPEYNVLSTVSNNVEIRDYSDSVWSCTNTTVSMFQDSTLFWRLFGYIQGTNDQSQKMAMTAPVIMWNSNIDKSAKSKTSSTKSMCFYVPKQFHSKTPQPTNKDVYLMRVPRQTVATIRFGGFASAKDYANKQSELVSALGADAKNYNVDMYLMAGYDSPFKFFDRKNEVWIKRAN